MRVPPEPWANGGGTTRTLARGPEQRGAAPWRVSIATLDGPAKFSQLAGYDRTLLPIGDNAVDLLSQDGQLLARAGQPDLSSTGRGPTRNTSYKDKVFKFDNRCSRPDMRTRVMDAKFTLDVSPLHRTSCGSGPFEQRTCRACEAVLSNSVLAAAIDRATQSGEIRPSGPVPHEQRIRLCGRLSSDGKAIAQRPRLTAQTLRYAALPQRPRGLEAMFRQKHRCPPPHAPRE
ncbi:HutD family protein [Paraburkholderia nodosa]|uniref:HutD family protein n=1 Tax=Paraburkholderia nodosa TaxID=392320 RepID=UPI0012B69656